MFPLRLSLCTAHKDQAGIAKDLADNKDISEVYGLGEACSPSVGGNAVKTNEQMIAMRLMSIGFKNTGV